MIAKKKRNKRKEENTEKNNAEISRLGRKEMCDQTCRSLKGYSVNLTMYSCNTVGLMNRLFKE